MAKIIENTLGRRMIRLNTNDVISIVKEFQNITYGKSSYNDLRIALDKFDFYIPEDVS